MPTPTPSFPEPTATDAPSAAPGGAVPATPRALADAFLDAYLELNPVAATALGSPVGADRLPDLSPAGADAEAVLRRDTLAALDAMVARAGGMARLPDAERRCARLLRERLEASLGLHEAGEHLRSVGTLFSPIQSVRSVFTLMPAASEEDWDAVTARLDAVPQAYEGLRESFAAGLAAGMPAGPAQVDAVVEQLGQWQGADGTSWWEEYAAAAPPSHRKAALAAAERAAASVTRLRGWLDGEYGQTCRREGRDPVGAARYARFARYWTGAEVDLDEAYTWAWGEFARLDAELRAEARAVLPGGTVREAMDHLSRQGPAVEGVDAVRDHLQKLMDEAIRELDGVHFDLAPPVRRVEAMIAPAGSAAAPYYTRPSMDFTRPGRTWLPTMGQTRFPLWDLVSTWYHEGVPGHHLQLAQWVLVADRLSKFQTSLGSVGAMIEGWALYAERLMDELGYLTAEGARLGYLDAQQMRAVRVVIDIGMHLELPIPHDQGVPEPFAPGMTWTPALAREFFGRNCGRPAAFLDSELVRYLGMPAQAISYKLGERAWLEGRSRALAAARRHGNGFDARRWHMAALSLGSLGLADLVDEVAAL